MLFEGTEFRVFRKPVGYEVRFVRCFMEIEVQPGTCLEFTDLQRSNKRPFP